MSFRTRSVTYGKRFIRAFSREKQYLTCVYFPFLSSPPRASFSFPCACSTSQLCYRSQPSPAANPRCSVLLGQTPADRQISAQQFVDAESAETVTNRRRVRTTSKVSFNVLDHMPLRVPATLKVERATSYFGLSWDRFAGILGPFWLVCAHAEAFVRGLPRGTGSGHRAEEPTGSGCNHLLLRAANPGGVPTTRPSESQP